MLRLTLLLGLLLHKALWEAMKRDVPRQSAGEANHPAPFQPLKVVKVLALLFLLAQTAFLNVLPISRQPRPLRILGLAVYLAGLTTAVVGRLQLGSNWANIEDATVLPHQRLVTRGIYSAIRHPIYAGDLLLVAGLQLALNSWLALGALPLFALVVRRARAEERLLADQFPGYDDYRRRSSMLIPGVL